MAKVTDELLDHEYDGIREYDNPTPGWWNWLFFLSFVFSVAYFFHYHVGIGQGVVTSYEAEMDVHREQEAARALAERGRVSEQMLQVAMEDPTVVSGGETVFAQFCASCHNKDGAGLIGPNLTDDYWLYGDASLMAIRNIVAAGVPAKGMPAWDKVLSSDDLTKIVAYVGTLRGQNIQGKGPQGQKAPAGEPDP